MLEVRYVSERGLDAKLASRLLRYLLAHGADEFSITVMALQDTAAPFVDKFEDELGPYERDTETRRTHSTNCANDTARRVRLWTLTDASLARFETFLDSGIFHWPAGPDGWFEDLAIFRRGECVLGVSSDAQEAVLRLTREEHAEAAVLGIVSTPTAEWIAF